MLVIGDYLIFVSLDLVVIVTMVQIFRHSPSLDMVQFALIMALAAKGFRTLGVARKEEGQGWTFLAILPMSAPPRQDSAAMIKQARMHGVGVKIVTGDNVAIARQISGQLWLGRDIQPAGVLFGSDGAGLAPDLGERVEKADGFAQVFPGYFPSINMPSCGPCKSAAILSA